MTIGEAGRGRGQIEGARAAGAGGDDTFGRIVRLVKDNDRLFAELAAIHARIGRARSYLADPDCHLPLALALANLSRLKATHSGLLARLRSNRIEALHALGMLGERAA